MLRTFIAQFLALMAMLAVAAAWDEWNRPATSAQDAEIDALFREYGLD